MDFQRAHSTPCVMDRRRGIPQARTPIAQGLLSPKSANELAKRVRHQLARDGADIVAFASEMIAIPSENPPGTYYARCAGLIARWLRELGLDVRIVNPSKQGPCVTGTFGSGGRALYFSGHYDVVPAQDRAQFKPAVRKTNLHGRGAADMKGGIAAMAFAIRALAASGFEPNGRLISVSVPDEETSGPRGTVRSRRRDSSSTTRSAC